MTSSPSLALVLNAHLPFVRKPQYAQFYEERWLFEVISETYLPLLRMFHRLELENIPFKLSMVFLQPCWRCSPTGFCASGM